MRNAQIFKVLSATLVLSMLLVACGPAATAAPQAQETQPTAAAEQPNAQAPAGEKPKMTIWIGVSYTPKADLLNKTFAEEWAAKNGVELTVVQESGTVLTPLFNAAIETNTLPDVLSWTSPDWAPKLHRLGLALDVIDIVNMQNKQGGGLVESATRAVMATDGAAFAIPTHSATEIFYVRKDLLEASGLKVPETWEDVYAVAKAVSTDRVWGYGQQLGTTSYDAEVSLLSMLASYGASPYAADAKTLNLNNDGTRKVLTMIKQAYDDGSVPPDAVTWDDSGNNKAYLTKASAMIYNTGSVLNAMRKDDPDLLKNTVFTRIPKGDKGSLLLGYIYGLIIAKTSKYPDLAKDLVTYMVDVERVEQVMEAAGSNYMPLYKDLANAPMWQDPINQIFISQLADNNAIGYPGPTSEWALEAWRTHTITQMVNKVIVENKTIDVAIKETEDALTKIYAQYH